MGCKSNVFQVYAAMFSLVKTDVKNLFITLAFSLSVVVKFPCDWVSCDIVDLVFNLDRA